MVPIVPVCTSSTRVFLPSVIILEATHKVYFWFYVNKRIIVKDFFLMMHSVNAQYSEKNMARKQCKPIGSEGRTSGIYSLGFSPPFSLLPFYVAAITVLSKVRLDKNKAADLSTQISLIS